MVLIWNQKRIIIIDLEWFFFNKSGSYQKSEFGKVEWVVVYKTGQNRQSSVFGGY